MKDNLNIYAKNNEFFIKTHHTDLADLRIIKGNNRILFDKSDYFTWKINGQDIASILDYENEDRAYIYYENEEQINATNFIVRYSDHCYVEINHKKIFCYVTLDKKIRFIWNQAPSIKAYYKSTTINNIYEKSDGILLEASVHSQFIPLTKAQLIVRNRQTKLEIPVENLCSTSLKKETNTFENKLQFKLEPNKIIPIIHPNINYNEYDTTILDFSIQLDSTKFPLTKIQYRVPYTENKATETWCSFSKEAMFLFSWYNTQNGYLSSRIGTLNRNEYSYYLDLCENDTIESEKKGNIVLVSEYPHKAQDNGFFFFKYLMEKQTKFEPYYVITTDSPDLINLKSYKNHVVFYKSKEHLKLLFTANYLIHSHSSNYVLPFYSETLLQEKVKMKKIFLQHGILYYRNMNYLYGYLTQPDFTDCFLVSSKREKEQVHKQLNYPYTYIKLTGLARFDNLLKKNKKIKNFFLKKKILIMPTWRINQDHLTDVDFLKTDFYIKYNELINDAEFKNLARRNHLKINFYLHNNFQKYSHLFHSDFVNILTDNENSVQKLLKNHGVLITDYSSVGLDFSLLKRTVFYYQFDAELFQATENINQTNINLPGPIFKTKEALLINLKRAIKNNNMDQKYIDIVNSDIYIYNDEQACKRIYDVLDSM